MKFIIFISTLSIIQLMTSCCPKVDCLGVNGLFSIEFVNFTHEDLDTLVVNQYVKNSDFTSPTKSSTIVTYFDAVDSSYMAVNLPNRIDTNCDYSVLLVSTGQRFTITDFEVKKENCGSNVLCNNQYNVLTKYKVNGISQLLAFLRISKQKS